MLNCAGPYIYTAQPIVKGCLRSGTHYLDLTGKAPVYDSMAGHDHEAKSQGVMLLPSVGFDFVPTDCLAAHLQRRLPTATHLTLAFHSQGPAGFRGYLDTLVEMIPYGSNRQRRSDGKIENARGRRKTRMIDFGSGPVKASMLTWGDVHLAYRSTGIPNIEDYAVLSPKLVRQMDLTDRIRPLFKLAAIRNAAKKTIRGGATPDERAKTSTSVWGEVVDNQGRKATSRLHRTGRRLGLDRPSHARSGEACAGRRHEARIPNPLPGVRPRLSPRMRRRYPRRRRLTQSGAAGSSTEEPTRWSSVLVTALLAIARGLAQPIAAAAMGLGSSNGRSGHLSPHSIRTV